MANSIGRSEQLFSGFGVESPIIMVETFSTGVWDYSESGWIRSKARFSFDRATN
jgi:hypothetical protein